MGVLCVSSKKCADMSVGIKEAILILFLGDYRKEKALRSKARHNSAGL